MDGFLERKLIPPPIFGTTNATAHVDCGSIIGGNMSKQMDATATAKLFDFPVNGPYTDDDYQEPKRGWFRRRFEEAGIVEMATTSTRPPGYNWTVIGGICVVITTVILLAGLFCTATWFLATQANQIHNLENENLRLQHEIEKAQSDAAEAKKFGIYAAAGEDQKNGHKPNQEKK